jgi:hypothetical protein
MSRLFIFIQAAKKELNHRFSRKKLLSLLRRNRQRR